jgi:hypothetical protein
MKTLKILLNLLVCTIFIMSCSSENNESEGVFTSEQAAKSMDDFSTSMHTDIVDMVNSTGTETLTDLVDLISTDNLFTGRIDSDETRKERIIQRLRQVNKVFIPKESVSHLNDVDRFEFEKNLGIYNYDAKTEKFIKTADVVDNIQINFPSEGSVSNNATLRILNFEDVLIENEDSMPEYIPAILVADLSVNAAIVVSLDLEVNWSSNGLPEVAQVALFVIPFDYILNFSNTATTSSSLSFSVSKDNDVIIDTNVNIEFKTKEKETVATLTGDVSFREFKLVGELNIAALEAAEGDENANINDYVNLAFYMGNNKIGDVLLEESANGEDLEAYMVYSDGSKELLETVLQPILDEIETLLESLEGNG